MSVPSNRSIITVLTALTLVVSVAVFQSQPGNTMQHSKLTVQLQPGERVALNTVEEEGIRYFIENQLPNGMILDRQANRGTPRFDHLISTSATGMGLIAIAIASSPEHRMLSRADAVARVRKAIQTSLTLRNDHGMLPHFLDPVTLQPIGQDAISTIDSGWLIAGALWAAEYLDDAQLQSLACQLEARVDWQYWSTQTDNGIELWQGADETGKKLPYTYNRYNSEVAFLYMLAIGANNGDAIPAKSWYQLQTADGLVAGIRLVSADLGLFAFQYSGALIDFDRIPLHGMPDLNREASKAAVANFVICRRASDQYRTFTQYWGLSAGDGPPDAPGQPDNYRVYAPGQIDGTAHITATLASIEEVPDLVLDNMRAADADKQLNPHGRYGYSNINVDKDWVSQDVVGIDIGAAVMALENELNQGRVRRTWHRVPTMRRAQRRLKAVK